MKNLIWIAGMILLSLPQTLFAREGTKKQAGTEINWISFEEAESRMKKEPRKVLIDVYTDWCGWCKVMDKKTYSNPELIRYVNTHYYAVKFNAEQKEPIRFLEQDWPFVAQNKANKLAIELMQGRMSYPTTIIMEENFKNAQPIPGFLEVDKMESVLRFFAEDHYKTTKWEAYLGGFRSAWSEKKDKG